MLGGQSASRGPAAPACSLPELLEESQNMTVTHIPSSEHSMLADNLHPRVIQHSPSCSQISAPFTLTGSSQSVPLPPHTAPRDPGWALLHSTQSTLSFIFPFLKLSLNLSSVVFIIHFLFLLGVRTCVNK